MAFSSTKNTSSASTTVTATADLSIGKTDGPDPVLRGDDITYTLTYQNDGPSPATGVSIIDVLPSDVTFVSATPDQGTCGELAGVATCDIGNVPVGGSGQVTIDVTVSDTATPGTTVTNNVAINAITFDPNNSNNTASAVTTIQDEADLSVSKSDSPDPVTAGEQLTYTITYDNLGLSDATGVVVTDVLPAGVTLVSLTPDQGSCDVLGGTITCDVGAVAAADPAGQIVVVVDIDPSTPDGTTLTNTVSIAGDQVDPNSANDSATEETTVATSADVSLTKSDAPDPVVAGEQLTYTLDYANAGPSDSQDVSVVDGLPAGVTFVSATSDQGSCSEAASTVTCDLGTLPAGASGQIVIVVDVDPSTPPGTITNTATANPNTADPNFTNNSVSVDTTVVAEADMSISKDDAMDPVFAGGEVVYTVGYENLGPSDAASVQVVDTLPAGVVFVSAVSDDGSCSEASGVVTCDLGTIPAGAAGEITIVVEVPADASEGTVTNSVTVSTDTDDPEPDNDTATEDTTIETSADLSVTKTVSPSAVNAGDNVTYTITYSNAGPSTAVDVVVTDTLSSALTFVSATPSSGSCSEAAGTVTCNVGDVAAGGGGNVMIVATVSAGASAGEVSNSASVSAATTDPTPGDNTDVAAFQVNADSGTTTTTTPGTTTTTATGDLPFTGSNTRMLAVVASIMLLTGLLFAGHRRTEVD